MRMEDAGGGKSINFALSTRGIHALKEVGMFDEIKKIAIPMYGRMIHPPEGELNFQRYGKDDSEYINSVSRAELHFQPVASVCVSETPLQAKRRMPWIEPCRLRHRSRRGTIRGRRRGGLEVQTGL